jgi:hypothetical protein
LHEVIPPAFYLNFLAGQFGPVYLVRVIFLGQSAVGLSYVLSAELALVSDVEQSIGVPFGVEVDFFLD